MLHADKQSVLPPAALNDLKWSVAPRLKDIIPLPEGWLDHFFTTVNVIAETGCIEKQCKIPGCQKTYKGSNGITSNFAKHVRKNHPAALLRYAEQNRSWKHRTSERLLDPTTIRSTCESDVQHFLTANDEAESEPSDGAYENEDEPGHVVQQLVPMTHRLLRSAVQLLQVESERERDDAAAFGNLVVSELRSVADERVRDALKIRILTAIFEAKHSVPSSSRSILPGIGTNSSFQRSDKLQFSLDSASNCNC